MVPLVGSGNLVIMAVVAEDEQPLEESSVENQGWLVKTAITDKCVLHWMLVLSQIGLYVVRRDRYLCFFENESNQARLWIFFPYVHGCSGRSEEKGINYPHCVGMNDICSSMIILLEDPL